MCPALKQDRPGPGFKKLPPNWVVLDSQAPQHRGTRMWEPGAQREPPGAGEVMGRRLEARGPQLAPPLHHRTGSGPEGLLSVGPTECGD